MKNPNFQYISFQPEVLREDWNDPTFWLSFEEMIESSQKLEFQAALFYELLPRLIHEIWKEFSMSEDVTFYCNKPFDNYWEFNEFGIVGYEIANYPESTQDYFRTNVGFPPWVSLQIEYVYLEVLRAEFYDSLWSQSDFMDCSENFRLLCALAQSDSDDDLILSDERQFIAIKISQNDDIKTDFYYNILDFDVIVDLDFIKQNLKPTLFVDRTAEEQIKIAEIALKASHLQSDHEVDYFLCLMLNHPRISQEAKSLIFNSIQTIQKEYIKFV